MTKSQNTKNEQLTEKWVNIYKSKKYGDSYCTGTFGYRTKEDAIEDLADKENYLTTINIEEVLKLQDDNKRLKHDVGNLGYKIKNQRHEIERQIAQNAQLKELLKEVKDYLPEFETPMNILAKIDEVLK